MAYQLQQAKQNNFVFVGASAMYDCSKCNSTDVQTASQLRNANPRITAHASYNMEVIAEGSLEVKLPTIWTDEKQSREEAERRERLEERRVEEKE